MTDTKMRAETAERAFAFLGLNERSPKPRSRGVTEIRGYIEQLCALGLLRQTGDEFPVLALSDAGVALFSIDLFWSRGRKPVGGTVVA